MIKLKAFVKPERRKIVIEYWGDGGDISHKEHYIHWQEIVQHEELGGHHGFFLFHCDDEGNVLVDDYLFTLKNAFYNAYLQYGIKPEDWRVVDE